MLQFNHLSLSISNPLQITRGLVFLLMTSLLCIYACDDSGASNGDDRFSDSEKGSISVTPYEIAIVPPVLGESVITETEVRNIGGGNLRIIDIYFSFFCII